MISHPITYLLLGSVGVASASVSCDASSLNYMLTEFFTWTERPLTVSEALANGWSHSAAFPTIPGQLVDDEGCVHGIGVPYVFGNITGPTTEYPLVLYYSQHSGRQAQRAGLF